jgi:hypothetical protein
MIITFKVWVGYTLGISSSKNDEIVLIFGIPMPKRAIYTRYSNF